MNPVKKKRGRGPRKGKKSTHKKILKEADVGIGKTK